MSWQDDPIAQSNKSIGGWENDPVVNEPGKVESFARGAANNFPLLPQAIAAGEKLLPSLPGEENTYSKNLADWNQKAKIAKEANPKTYGVGAVAGSLAPLAIPGIGEALEAYPLAGNAVLGAANAVSNTDLSKNQGQALKEGTMGAALGAGTAWGLGKLLPNASTLENFAEKKGLQSTGIGSKQLGSLSDDELSAAQKFVSEHGLIGTNKEEVIKKALAKQDEIGKQIGSVGEQLNNLGIKAGEDDILKAVGNLQSKAAETAGLENPELRKMAIWHNKGANDIFNKLGDDPSWSSIQKLKQAYGKAAFSDTGEVKNEASKNVYFTLRDMLKDLTSKATQNPQLPQEYKTALAGYHTIDPVIDGLQKLVGQERAGVSHAGGHGFLSKMIHSLPGQSNPLINLGTAAAATAVSPHLGPLLALPTLTNPAVQSKVASTVARNLPGIKQGATQEIINYLESKYGKRNP